VGKMVSYDYGGSVDSISIASLITGLISLALIVVSFIVITYLFYRVRSVKSLQFGIFIFALILLISEGPRILNSLGILNLTPLENVGLLLHTISMAFLSGFIAVRVYRYFRGGKRIE
jgi:hypothetical protein